MAQYPMNMGRKDAKSGKVIALSVDEDGQTQISQVVLVTRWQFRRRRHNPLLRPSSPLFFSMSTLCFAGRAAAARVAHPVARIHLLTSTEKPAESAHFAS